MSVLQKLLGGDGLRARAMRGSAWMVLGYGGSQVLRLASNLILTRLMFPEAFGLMALVAVFMQGLANFSDMGIGPSIMQSKRGDERDYLNTAWAIQVVRGIILWIASCAIAIPVARFYGEPQLAQLIPVVGLGLVISGFNPTRLETAHRHLLLGRVNLIQIATQVVGIFVAILFALLTHSVWAFVISGLVSNLVHLVLLDRFLPGDRNRFCWEKPAVGELVHFGKWIFLSTVCGFLVSQGDKLVLGKYLTIDMLGIYNIGYFLASFPMLLSITVINKVMIPLYREKPPADSAENFRALQMMRFGVTTAILALVSIFALFGVGLVEFLYDPRYATAGAIVVLTAVSQIPAVIVLTYDQAALASGDSRRFFVLTFSKALLLICAILIGVQLAGLLGVIVGQAVAMLLVYPVVVWLARRQGAWDPLHDVVYAAVGLMLGGLAVWLSLDTVLSLKNIGLS
ncbi:MAG: oligosaccharide flippase family protein [Rhodobacteraceae bacterium]|nr:oligosaccharide flippase family protein [Paracoccaceae bacterium]